MTSDLWGASWLPTARKNRKAIYDWNDEFSPKVAKAVDAQIAQTVKSIRQRPLMGREGRVEGTRERVLKGGRYLIVYVVDEVAKTVEITNVVHTAQQFPSV